MRDTRGRDGKTEGQLPRMEKETPIEDLEDTDNHLWCLYIVAGEPDPCDAHPFPISSHLTHLSLS